MPLLLVGKAIREDYTGLNTKCGMNEMSGEVHETACTSVIGECRALYWGRKQKVPFLPFCFRCFYIHSGGV